MNAPPSPAEQRVALLARVAQLPQAAHIQPAVAAAWLDGVLDREPRRASWHVERLRGFGGSEIGALVSAARGQYHPHTQAADIVRGKLMIQAPAEPSGDARRGEALEPHARAQFRLWAKTNLGARPAEDVLCALQGASNSRYPWQVGNLDDAFWLPGGELLIPDYKAPRATTLAGHERFGVPLDYVCQLHHYAMIARDRGFPVARLMLVCFDGENWRLLPHEVPLDQALCDEIGQAGDRFWREHVLTGAVPALIEKPTLDPAKLPEPAYRMAREIAKHLALAKSAYSRAHDLNALLATHLGERFFAAGSTVAVEHMDITSAPSVDEQRLARRLALWGEDINAYRQPDQADPVAMEKKLIELGVDPKPFYTRGRYFDIDRIKQRLRRGHEDPGQYVHDGAAVKLTQVRTGARGRQFLALRAEARAHVERFAAAEDVPPTPKPSSPRCA